VVGSTLLLLVYDDLERLAERVGDAALDAGLYEPER
jgi:hypothetical protein